MKTKFGDPAVQWLLLAVPAGGLAQQVNHAVDRGLRSACQLSHATWQSVAAEHV